MKKAEQLLRETKLPINQISEAIGIVNTNYFYSIFKKKYGMTPLAYRRTRSGEAEGYKIRRTGRNHRVIHPVLRTVHELSAVDFHNFSENELIFCAFTLIMCIEH